MGICASGCCYAAADTAALELHTVLQRYLPTSTSHGSSMGIRGAEGTLVEESNIISVFRVLFLLPPFLPFPLPPTIISL